MARLLPFLIALLVILAAALIGVSFLIDKPVEQAVLAANGGHWCRSLLATTASRYGDWPELMLLGGAGYLLARRTKNVRWQRLLLSAMIASTSSP